MSRSVEFYRSYISDYKKMTKRGFDKQPLDEIIERLILREPLPTRSRPHKLVGRYTGLWECHVRNDLLLIWEESEDLIVLVRLGTHVDLFKEPRNNGYNCVFLYSSLLIQNGRKPKIKNPYIRDAYAPRAPRLD